MSTSIQSKQPYGRHALREIAQVRKESQYYRHIDGLRGLAIALVVIFHIFVGRVSSGVDIFLLIGGIFFVSGQIRNAARKDGLTFFQVIIRLLRRLAPSLILVSFISAIYLMIRTKSISWQGMFYDLSASVSYWTNWRLIDKQLEYTAAVEGASLFQHLWSMSVQMQSYIFILLVITITFAICNKYFQKVDTSKLTVSIIALLTIASFSYATYQFAFGNQNMNYYSTYSRFWEIGLGGVTGVYLSKISPSNNKVRWVMSIVGIVLVISTGFIMDGVKVFPGPLTLYPIIGALMVILAGTGKKSSDDAKFIREYGPVVWFLSTKTMKFVGNISYNLYLWHWIILVWYIDLLEKEQVDLLGGFLIVVISVLIATAVHYGVEKPLRQKEKPERGNVFSFDYMQEARLVSTHAFYPFIATVITVSTVIIAVSPFIYKGYVYETTKKLNNHVAAMDNVEKEYPGGQAAIANLTPPVNPIYPNLIDLASMMPPTTADGCYSGFGNTNLVLNKNNGEPCEYGDLTSHRFMYVVGGSHSEQFIPALSEIGKRNGFKIIPLIKMGCPLYQNIKNGGEEFPECSEEWSPKAEQYILENPPTDGIFNIGTRPATFWGSPPEIVPDFYVEFYKRMSQAGIPIYSLRDNAWIVNEDGPFDPRECVHVNGRNSDDCAIDATFFSPEDPSINAYRTIPNIKLIDITPAYIVDEKVRPVIGNILVYRDQHHLTRQFVETITNYLEHQMKKNQWTEGTTNTTREKLILEGMPEQASNREIVPNEIIIPGQTAEQDGEQTDVHENS